MLPALDRVAAASWAVPSDAAASIAASLIGIGGVAIADTAFLFGRKPAAAGAIPCAPRQMHARHGEEVEEKKCDCATSRY
ncbi:MAG TPA: hypothetical protein VHY76_14305 [Acetobacteraceae bacterium]|nr:hypothetical protein [Acetobacteraceae bacterium]